MSAEVLPEGALPLLDTEIDEPGMRDYVNGLLLAEMEAMAGEGAADEAAFLARLPPAPPPRASPQLAADLARASRGERPPPLSVSRYALPAVPSGAAAEDPAAWEAMLDGIRRTPDRRRVVVAAQDVAIAELRGMLDAPVWRIPDHDREVHDLAALTTLAGHLPDLGELFQ